MRLSCCASGFQLGFIFFPNFDELVFRVNSVSLDLLVKVKVGEALEDLLQGGLRDGVLVDVVGFLQLVYHTEHLADGRVLAGHSQAHVVTIGLEELNGAKDLADSLDGAIQVALSEQLLG